MKTAAFILFAVVTAAAAALSTLVASRYLTLEKELSDNRVQLEDVLRERKKQEGEKMSLRLEKERVQSDLEARFSEQRGQLEECANQRQRDFQEMLSALNNIQKRMSDIEVQLSPSALMERAKAQASEAQSEQSGASRPEGESRKPASVHPSPTSGSSNQTGQPPAKVTDVPKGAIPTPEQEARNLNKVQ
jgi:hypothetical protein